MHVLRSHRLSLVGVLTGLMLLGAALLARAGSGRHHHGGSMVTETKVTIRQVEQALVHYQANNAMSCPPTVDTLATEHYLAEAPLDAWDRPLNFQCPGLHAVDGADVSSAGKDGVFGTADDLVSWEL